MDSVISEHIEITPGVCFGKPRIAGTRMSVIAIADMYLRMGKSVEEIAGRYDLSLASIHAAMVYYNDNVKMLWVTYRLDMIARKTAIAAKDSNPIRPAKGLPSIPVTQIGTCGE